MHDDEGGRGGSGRGLEGRLRRIERSLAALGAAVSGLAASIETSGGQVVTRRLSIVDDEGRERIVAGVVGGTAQLVVSLTSGSGDGELVAYASDGASLPGGAPAVGLHLRAGGDAVLELDAAPAGGGPWRAVLVADGGRRL